MELKSDGLWYHIHKFNSTTSTCDNKSPSRWSHSLLTFTSSESCAERAIEDSFASVETFPKVNSFFGQEKFLIEGSDIGESEVDISAGLNPRKFDLNDPLTNAFARLINEKLAHWLPIKV